VEILDDGIGGNDGMGGKISDDEEDDIECEDDIITGEIEDGTFLGKISGIESESEIEIGGILDELSLLGSVFGTFLGLLKNWWRVPFSVGELVGALRFDIREIGIEINY
jgi:hypothetical protein